VTLDPDLVRRDLSRFSCRELTAAGRHRAAVLVPLCSKNGETHLLFTRRDDQLPLHRGEICFPGGEQEPEDRDAAATALREAEEEIGLAPADVRLLGRLDDFVTRFHFHVVPFVGLFPCPYPFRINRSEVAEVMEIPLRVLADPAVFRRERREVEGAWFDLCFFELDHCLIWGLTGAILRQFLDRAVSLVPG
jgi:8-oxo-dGTP pyrophosphatase MutT (NUDIX family)